MTTAAQLKALFKQLNSKNIVFNKAYYKLSGSVAGAVLLSHLTYLFSEVFGGDEFYQSDAQLMDSLGFSLKTLRTSKESIKLYITATKRGIPAKNHWVVHEEIIIQELLKLPAPKKRCKLGITSHAENGITVAAENGITGDAENGTCNNKELPNNKELKINNNSAVVKKMVLDAKSVGVTEQQINDLVEGNGEAKVRLHLNALLRANGVHSPIAWLTDAIKRGYTKPVGAMANIASYAANVWDEAEYKRQCREAEKLSDPNDWREQMMRTMR